MSRPAAGPSWLAQLAADAGQTVLEPPGEGSGYWAGAPSAVYDPDGDRY